MCCKVDYFVLCLQKSTKYLKVTNYEKVTMTRRATRRTDFDVGAYSDMRCPMHGMLNLLSGPWTTYILWLIRQHGTLRFGQIKKQIPSISAKMLTERLRMLEDADILVRHQEATIPPKVSYSFTPRGHQLESILDDINGLAQTWARATDKKRSSKK